MNQIEAFLIGREFYRYFYKIKKADTPKCIMCLSENDDAEYILFSYTT